MHNQETRKLPFYQIDGMNYGKVHSISEMAAAASENNNVCCCSSDVVSSKRETFTVWMKSLVMQGNGCTVFNHNGDIVYRMDNYDTKRSRRVYLMDLRGKVLFTILKKKLRLFGCWEGYNNNVWFRVKKNCSFLKEKLSCEITVFSGKIQRGCCSIEGSLGKFDFKINNSIGTIIAEVTRKQASSGVDLGNDVFSLIIEPQVDHSLVVALVAVYGSICNRI